MNIFESFVYWIDWSSVFEVALGAILAFAFAAVLQSWLLRRQERFQTKLLERQLAFMEKLEQDRAANDAKAEQARTAALQAVVGHHNTVLRQIALDERNHETKLHSQDNWEARQRTRRS